MKRKRTKINLTSTLEILKDGYGLDARQFNSYQLRLRHPESKNIYDWYFTTGALVAMTPEHYFARIGTEKNPELVAMRISRHVYRR